MLHGHFGATTGRPYIEGRLVLPRLSISSDISFLVDTGSDVTVLSVVDSMRIDLNLSELDEKTSATGVGGPQQYFVEPAVVAFTEPGRRLVGYSIRLHISPIGSDERLVSLIGRDVLDRLRMVYHPSAGRLTFTVQTADITIPI